MLHKSQSLLESAINYVSYRLRSKSEIETYLRRRAKTKGFSSIDVQSAFERLSELGYVDDLKYAKAFVQTRLALRPKGKKVLLSELNAKGIDREMAETVIREKMTDDDGESISERELAMRALKNRLSLWEKFPPLERKKKIYSFLALRGFSSDTIRSIVDGADKND